jgi:hypothetical protein
VTPDDDAVRARVKTALDALVAALPIDPDSRVLSTAVGALLAHVALASERGGGLDAEAAIAVLCDGALEMVRINTLPRITARTVGEA